MIRRTSARGPRVLYLTHHLPYPPRSGGRLREFELLRRAGEEAEIHLVAVSKTVADDRANAERLLAHLSGVDVLEACQARGDGRLAPQVARHSCPDAHDRIRRLLRRGFDALHVEGFYLWPLLDRIPRAELPPVLLVEHNVEYILWEQRAFASEDGRRSELLAAAAATRRAEVEAWHGVDGCAAVTEEDRSEIAVAAGREVALIPDGFDHLRPPAPSLDLGRDRRPRVVMVGNFGYEPNVDATLWFLREIVPILHSLVPDAEVELVGASPPPALIEGARRQRGVSVHADVPSVEPFLDRAQVFACSLRVGGGVKVKMLEALARGKAIVSTSVGVQGLGATDGSVVVADDPGEFARAAADLLANPARRRRLEREALRFANTQLPRWDDCAEKLLHAYSKLALAASGAGWRGATTKAGAREGVTRAPAVAPPGGVGG